jgi:Terminase small subunit
MPGLKNNRHETFASRIAAGKSCAEAYISAGYKVKHSGSARACGSKLLRNATVAARMAELQPVIDARLEESAKEMAQVVEDEVLTSMRRVVSLAIRRRRMLDARAKDPESQWAPGGNTGMIITGEKAVASRIVRTHEFDATISRELRETEKQIAIELKQWSEKVDHKFDPVQWLRTATPEELLAALPGVRAEREKLRLPPYKPN